MKEKSLRELEAEARARIMAALPRLWNGHRITRLEAKALSLDLALVRRAESIDDDEIRMRIRGGVGI